MSLIFALGAFAFLISFFLTPLVRDVFLKMGVVDAPDQERKLHKMSIPRVGGIAIFLAYTISYAGMTVIREAKNSPLRGFDGEWWFFSAVTVVFLTGLLDDLLTLRPKHKLLGQIIAA